MSKKIVFTIDSNLPGGAERVTSILANYFVEKNYEVTVINSDTKSDFYSFNENVKVIKMGLDSKEMSSIGRFLEKYLFLKKFLKMEKPDVVITFLFHMELPTILAALATRVRVFTSVRNSALSYTKIERFIRRRLYPHISGVVYQSDQVMNFEDFKNVKNKTVIMNPLSIDNRPIVEFSNRKKWIINVGRLNAQKNQKLLIDAFSMLANKYKDYSLHIFGTGELKDELSEYISTKDCSNRIILEGELLNAIQENRDAFAFVLSSNFEGFPNVLAEAMAYGIPVLSTDFDSGVAAQLITSGVNGFLCPVGQMETMSNQIEKILLLKEEEYIKIAKKAQNVQQMLDVNTIGRQWEQFVFPEDL